MVLIVNLWQSATRAFLEISTKSPIYISYDNLAAKVVWLTKDLQRDIGVC